MTMKHESSFTPTTISNPITVEDVNRILEVGKLLLSVLTPEELASLQQVIDPGIQTSHEIRCAPLVEMGNTGITEA